MNLFQPKDHRITDLLAKIGSRPATSAEIGSFLGKAMLPGIRELVRAHFERFHCLPAALSGFVDTISDRRGPNFRLLLWLCKQGVVRTTTHTCPHCQVHASSTRFVYGCYLCRGFKTINRYEYTGPITP